MKIDGFKVDGIFNIENANLRTGELCALIAPNGYGKSNVLRAIDFGIRFLTADDAERRQMLNGRWMSINTAIYGKDFSFEIAGRIGTDDDKQQFVYFYQLAWTRDGKEGRVVSESLKIKRSGDQRYRQLINRASTNECLIIPSAAGRCNKPFEVAENQLALSAIALSAGMYLNGIAKEIYGIQVPNLETLDNPESYFSVGGGRGIQTLGGMTLSEYLYRLKTDDEESYAILVDGLMQLIPNIEEFAPEVVSLPGGQQIYDVRIKEKYCAQPTTIAHLSSGSKRMIFLFTLCIAARKRNIPMIMLEEPENSVHPRMMENLLLSMQNYAKDTKILMTSHSPYLMRYLQASQMYFGLPKHDGLAHFAQVEPSKLKYLFKYAGEMELTFGEFMFDFMLDVEDDSEKLEKFFIQE